MPSKSPSLMRKLVWHDRWRRAMTFAKQHKLVALSRDELSDHLLRSVEYFPAGSPWPPPPSRTSESTLPGEPCGSDAVLLGARSLGRSRRSSPTR